MKILDKWFIKPLLITSLVVAGLIGLLGQKDGTGAAETVVYTFATGVGATIGLLPGAAEHLKDGRAMTSGENAKKK